MGEGISEPRSEQVPTPEARAGEIEARVGEFADFLIEKFSGQEPVQESVERNIQPREEPDLKALPSINEILKELDSTGDWQEMPHNMGYLSSGEPAGEQPEWVEDYLHIYLPPGAENGDRWAQMVVHRGRRGQDNKPVAAEPYAMISYYPRGKAEDESQKSPSRMEVLFFSRWDSAIQKEVSSVTRVYQERTPPTTPSALAV